MILKKVFEESALRQAGAKQVRQYYLDSAGKYLVIAQVEKLSGKTIFRMKVPYESGIERLNEQFGHR